MLDFITVPLVMAIITTGIYRLFELYARRKERIMLIERMKDCAVQSPVQPPAFMGNLQPSLFGQPSFSALKVGLLLLGLGLGLLVGFSVCYNFMPDYVDDPWRYRSVASIIYGASVLLFGGLGLVLAFVLELRLARKEER